jgi:hypothetical protein
MRNTAITCRDWMALSDGPVSDSAPKHAPVTAATSQIGSHSERNAATDVRTVAASPTVPTAMPAAGGIKTVGGVASLDAGLDARAISALPRKCPIARMTPSPATSDVPYRVLYIAVFYEKARWVGGATAMAQPAPVLSVAASSIRRAGVQFPRGCCNEPATHGPRRSRPAIRGASSSAVSTYARPGSRCKPPPRLP